MEYSDKIKVWELHYLQETKKDKIRKAVKRGEESAPSWPTVKKVIDEFPLLTPAQAMQLPDALQARWRELQPTRSDKGQGAPDKDLLSAAKETFKSQLFTPAPEDILIDDLGSLGAHSARLMQNTLNVVLQSLGYTVGVKATVSTTTWGTFRPREAEIFWSVSPNLFVVESYCPVERDPQFQHWLASVSSTVKQAIGEWKRLGGSYLTQCVQTRMKIHESARQETRAWLGEGLINLIAGLPGKFPSPPQLLTVNFGNLIYQLAIEYCRSDGVRGLPDENFYHTMPGVRPPFVKLVLGPTQIPLGNPLPGIVQTWIDLHRRMIEEWGQSREIGMLLYLFERLREIEETIKKGLMTDYPTQQDSPPVR